MTAVTAVCLMVGTVLVGTPPARSQTATPSSTVAQPPTTSDAEAPSGTESGSPPASPAERDTAQDDRDAAREARITEDLGELARLAEEAGALGEELHLARAELDRATADRDRLVRAAGVAAARSALADGVVLRDQSVVDRVATMRYRGGDLGATRAAVLAESPEDLLRRLDALHRLTGATTSALDASRAASAESARLRGEADEAAAAAEAATRDAQRRADDLERRTDEMRLRMEDVRRRVDALTDSQRALWVGGPLAPEDYVAPPVDDANSAALRVALSRLGAPYSWGATGPSEFDCSGLMVWAYAREGKTLPRSSQAQAVAGAPVAMADVRPGDLVIYYPGATHVGMYAGDGLVVHAPTYGVPVRLERVDAMPIHGIRRY